MLETEKKYTKDFITWGKKKQHIEQYGSHKKVQSGEVWWSKLGVNIGREQDGGKTFERPVIVIRKINYFLALIVPLTSQVKNPHSLFYYGLQEAKINSVVLLLQMRIVSTKRLTRFIERLTKTEHQAITKKIASLYKLKP